jgi:hypothetical protein
MKKSTLQVACVILFCSASAANADTTSTSNSGATSGSTSTGVGIGQGGGSSLNNISTNSTSSVTGTSTSSSVGGLGVATASGGSSNVTVNVQMAQATPRRSAGSSSGNGSTADISARASDGPGTSPYDTRATVDYNQGSYSVRSTPSIGAPALTTTLSDTCMGSASFGLSITGFGATGGTTLVDQACVRRLDAREFRAMGLTDVALALLCQSDSNRRAVEATGHLCPGTTAPLAKTQPKAETSGLTDDEKYRDPIVRERLGLPNDSEATVTKANDPQVKMASISNKELHPLQAAKPIEVPASIVSKASDIQTMPIPDSGITVSPLAK